MPIDNIHDKFFKESFSRKETVKGLIQELFPIELRENINLESLELSNNSFIDETLNEHFADLVYLCKYQGKHKIRISFLFEHKSYQEPYPHLQLLRYLLNAWEQDKKEKKGLTLMIPIIIYHGKKVWKYEPLTQYFKGIDQSLTQFLPNFEYLLFDISRFSDTEIFNFKNRFLSLSLMLLKNSRLKAYLLVISESLIQLMRDIENQGDMNYIRSILVYTLSTNEDLTKQEIITIFRQVSSKTEQMTMSTADIIRKEGKIEGKIETTVQFVKGMSQIGMDAATIAVTFNLQKTEVEDMIEKIKKGLL
jgi:predicted transposase/invertase (TIGR01784 family)